MSLCFLTSSTTTEPSLPAFTAICLTGSSKAFLKISTPIFSPSSTSTASRESKDLNNATPPPTTIPSSTAALVAAKASSMRCFFSFISVSVAAPTLITATPPANFAKRSCNFSRSKSELTFSICCLICSTRCLICSASPSPSTMVVLSLVATIFLA